MKAINTNFTALDIGSSKITILACDLNISGEATVGYQGMFQSNGIKSGSIIDYNGAEQSIINSIYNLEKTIDKNINSVSISLSGAGIKSYYVYQKIRVGNAKITKDDIKKLKDSALQKFDEEEYSIIHYFPLEYVLDDSDSISNPIGMFGNILGCRYHVVVANSNQISNIIECFAKCHIRVREIVASPYSSGLAVLTEDEKSLGSMLIDLGATTTSYAIFTGNKLVYTGYIPIGSNHITSDIAEVLSIPLHTAEKLKVMYGYASYEGNNDSLISLYDIEPSKNYEFENNISSKELNMIISARSEEIVELIKDEYDKIGIDHLIKRRIVLTGGGSQLRGIKEIVSNNFNKAVRVGNPMTLPGFDIDHSSPSYCSAIGVVKNEMINLRKNSPFNSSARNLWEKFASLFKSNV